MNEFKLAGVTWTVGESDMPSLGITNPDTFQIFLQRGLTDQCREVTFYHELVHAIMFTMGEMEHDERFVDGFAHLLYQYEQQKVQ